MILSYNQYSKLSLRAATISPDTFEAAESLAEVICDSFCFGVISRLYEAGGLKDLESRIQRAIAYQVDLILTSGSADSFLSQNSESIASRSVTVGSTSESVTYADANEGRIAGGLRVAPLTISMLAPVKARGRELRR